MNGSSSLISYYVAAACLAQSVELDVEPHIGCWLTMTKVIVFIESNFLGRQLHNTGRSTGGANGARSAAALIAMVTKK